MERYYKYLSWIPPELTPFILIAHPLHSEVGVSAMALEGIMIKMDKKIKIMILKLEFKNFVCDRKYIIKLFYMIEVNLFYMIEVYQRVYSKRFFKKVCNSLIFTKWRTKFHKYIYQQIYVFSSIWVTIKKKCGHFNLDTSLISQFVKSEIFEKLKQFAESQILADQTSLPFVIRFSMKLSHLSFMFTSNLQ